jgi:L-seryl-tRNA(Ser) seleniumtransferase
VAADPRRAVPRTDVLLAEPRIAAATERLGRSVVKAAVGAAQDRARRGEIAPAEVADAAARALAGPATTLRPVLNATGVVVHTNLGRAPLSAAAQAALVTAAGYVDVEYDLATGRRATRGRGALAALLATVPGAGDALVVNNGAAALVLAATALARGREMVISRGELVEIGDGFRLPDLLVATGARIREVGTTNRTVLGDYADAIGPDTAFVLKVHPANFRVEGFTAAVDVRALATLGAPVVVDVGSGLLRPDPLLPAEPTAAGTLRAGAVLVTASGDKLLGGPQAGLVLGDAALVAQLRRHPLARALRADKLTLAALEATLRGPTPPVRAAVGADAELLRARATTLAGELAAAGVDAVAVPSDGAVGGGGAPGLRLPGAAVSLPAAYAGRLRTGDPAVVGRVERGRCLLDLRCVPAAADEVLLAAVRAVQPAGLEC